jgi:hypothetical protein
MGWFSDSKFAFCRGIANHAWKFPPELGYEAKRLTLTLHCANCGASRKDRVHQGSGEVETRSYHYADGYTLDLQGAKRPPKSELRHDGLQLLLDEAKRPARTRTRLRRVA